MRALKVAYAGLATCFCCSRYHQTKSIHWELFLHSPEKATHPSRLMKTMRSQTKLALTTPPTPPKRSPLGKRGTNAKKKMAQKVVKRKTKQNGGETESFGALTAANATGLKDKNIVVHTLILGTHPSVKSFQEKQYYGHPMNAFWWIAGDCLGFRRARGVSPSSGKPYRFTTFLRHNNTIPYKEQVKRFCEMGFALWDVVRSCHRPGSLDSDISRDVPNDIQGFCRQHTSVRRIVLANGASGSKFFAKHFRGWLDSGELVPNSDPYSQAAFSKWCTNEDDEEESSRRIVLVSALAVSPAAASYSYEEKRDFWETHVYAPGLRDHKR